MRALTINPSRLGSIRPLAVAALYCAIVAATLAVPSIAMAQDATTVTSVVRIPGETRIDKIEDLHFGDIIAGNTGGTITVALDDSVTTTGSVLSVGGNPHAAEFVITRQFLVDYPTYNGPLGTDTIQLTHISLPSETMTLRDFTTDFNRTGFFGLPGYFFRATYDFRIGGTLDVAADQEPGQYLGFFTVTIDYD